MRAPRLDQPFVDGVIATPAGPVPRVGTRMTAADMLGHWRVRWGIGRDDYRADPGLYAVGMPDASSAVLVTANYKLSLDALRGELDGIDAWILVLDTRGINVWCAAGKGTFSAEELVARIAFSRLAAVVDHRRVVVPQLGATGVAAHHVREGSGFVVTYGPVRARDIPAFLEAGMRATPEMREPTFTLGERVVLMPVEIVGAWKPAVWVLGAAMAIGLAFTHPLTLPALAGNVVRDAAPFVLGLLGGAVLTPALLPYLPPRSFAAKGAIVGAVLGAALALGASGHPAAALSSLLVTTAVASYVAMNFTGSTPFTSPTGVEREMRRWLPLQAGGGALAVLTLIAGVFVR